MTIAVIAPLAAERVTEIPPGNGSPFASIVLVSSRLMCLSLFLYISTLERLMRACIEEWRAIHI